MSTTVLLGAKLKQLKLKNLNFHGRILTKSKFKFKFSDLEVLILEGMLHASYMAISTKQIFILAYSAT